MNLTYKVLADNIVYGPIEMPRLIQWAEDRRVVPETWIMKMLDGSWIPAGLISDLRPYFANAAGQTKSSTAIEATAKVQPDELRQFELFAGNSNEELAQFLNFAEYLSCDEKYVLINRGEPGDAIYFLLSGTVRARIMVGYEEKDLTIIMAGEFFGEIAMLTHSARSADIIAVEPSRLLRVSAKSFVEMSQQYPNVAAPILFAMSRSLAARVSDLTMRLNRDKAAEHLWS
jgi:hypothetical protein